MRRQAATVELETHHRLCIRDARSLDGIDDATVQLVVTSPPYPMIEMWDDAFRSMADDAGRALDAGDGFAAFDAMHRELDAVWRECARVVGDGGFACINIGDATRTVNGDFCLYPNHARIVAGMRAVGFTPLPDILWRKPTNAPNKFMGSGMLPAGAYVTYEHEYVLIFRKGGKRVFASADARENRARSAFFWEERNVWFSDVWADLRGIGQRLGADGARERSAAFPLELPYRLISMYSAYGDTVLDPFAGTGTTLLAAAATGRNSIGVERLPAFRDVIAKTMEDAMPVGNTRIDERLAAHRAFVADREASGKPMRHTSEHYGFPVVTAQEKRLVLLRPSAVEGTDDAWTVRHRAGRADAAPEASQSGALTP